MSGTHEAIKPEPEDAAPVRVGPLPLPWPWQTVLVGLGALAAAGTGGVTYVSHGAVTRSAGELASKMDQVIEGVRTLETKQTRLEEGQRALDIKFARLEGEGTSEKFRELDTRLRAIEGLTAELRGARGERSK